MWSLFKSNCSKMSTSKYETYEISRDKNTVHNKCQWNIFWVQNQRFKCIDKNIQMNVCLIHICSCLCLLLIIYWKKKRASPPKKSICLNILSSIIRKRSSDLVEINSLFSRAIVSKLDYMEMWKLQIEQCLDNNEVIMIS